MGYVPDRQKEINKLNGEEWDEGEDEEMKERNPK